MKRDALMKFCKSTTNYYNSTINNHLLIPMNDMISLLIMRQCSTYMDLKKRCYINLWNLTTAEYILQQKLSQKQ